MGYNDCVPVSELPQADFANLFNELSYQVSRTIEFAHSNTNLANCLKPVVISESKGVENKKESVGGLVSVFQEQINKLKEANDLAEKAYNHARSVIGN